MDRDLRLCLCRLRTLVEETSLLLKDLRETLLGILLFYRLHLYCIDCFCSLSRALKLAKIPGSQEAGMNTVNA